MKKMLISAAVGAATLAMATFSSAQPAKADVDFYIGTPGVSVGYYRDRCRNYWYRRNHPYRCGYYHQYRSGYPYYRYRDRCFSRWYRETHPYRCRWWYRRHYDY